MGEIWAMLTFAMHAMTGFRNRLCTEKGNKIKGLFVPCNNQYLSMYPEVE